MSANRVADLTVDELEALIQNTEETRKDEVRAWIREAISELTADEFREVLAELVTKELEPLIQQAVYATLNKLANEQVDPDEGLEFKSEIAARLQAFLQERPRGIPLEDAWPDSIPK